MSTRIRILPHQWYDLSVFFAYPITQSSVAAGTAVTVTFSKFFAEAGPVISIASNRRNCVLTFGVKYLIPLLCLLATHTLSFSQSPSRFLIRSCNRRLREFISGFWLARHWASNPRSEATISWMPESLLPSSHSTTVWAFLSRCYTAEHFILSPGTAHRSHCSLHRHRSRCRWACWSKFQGTPRSFTWTM